MSEFLVVLPFHQADLKCATGLLNRHAAMKSPKIDSLILMPDNVPERDMKLIDALAHVAANKVRIAPQDNHAGEKKWPVGPGMAFLSAYSVAQKYKAKSWLFLEADCVPVTPDWLAKIVEAYAKCGKPFMGPCTVCHPPLPQLCVNGVAMYPGQIDPKIIDAIKADLHKPFDIVLSRMSQNDIAPTALMQFALLKDRKPVEWSSASQVRKAAVLVHGDKTGKLLSLLSSSDVSSADAENKVHPTPRKGVSHKTTAPEQHRKNTKSFYHSGDLGDIIYGLPTVRSLGGGNLILGPNQPVHPFITREVMTRERANAIIPLLKSQPYISDSSYADKMPAVDFDLNQFRNDIAETTIAANINVRLSTLQLRYFKQPLDEDERPWISVAPQQPPFPVLINRTLRYHGKLDWTKVLTFFHNRCAFVGSIKEYRQFCIQFWTIPYIRTDNLLDLAKIIAGSELLVANQSCPYAIAEAMKHDAILDIFRPPGNCHFTRPGLWHEIPKTYKGVDVETEVRKSKKKIAQVHTKDRINWLTLWDSFSGISLQSQSVASRLKSIEAMIVPTRVDATSHPPPEFDRKRKRNDKYPSIVLEAAPVLEKFVKPGDIIWTVWESTRLPAQIVKTMNTARCVIAPSRWCAEIFSANGVTVPVEVVPHGIDTTVFKPNNHEKGAGFTFGCAARFLDHPDGRRKNILTILQAFMEEFEHDSDVFLKVKAFGGSCPYNHPRILVNNIFLLCIEELAKWYQSLDALVNIPAGGGWELHLQEAMACGAVPIAPEHGGCTMFFNRSNGFAIDYSYAGKRYPPFDGMGVLINPDRNSLKRTMRLAVNDSELRAEKSAMAARSASAFTADYSASEFERVLKKYL